MQADPRAVVIEDDQDIRELVVTVLAQTGFDVSAAVDGRSGLDLIRTREPVLITLDIGLPDIDGVEVCRSLRKTSDAYVIMLSARTEEVDRLMGLATGADDYLTKPFSPRELRARAMAMMRRPRSGTPGTAVTPPGSVSTHGTMVLDADARFVHVDGRELDLTRTEFDLLAVLLSNPGRVWTRDMLLRQVWGPDWASQGHLVEVHMGNLRRKLSDPASQSRWIRTVRGVGYRLGPG